MTNTRAVMQQALYVIEAWARGCDESEYWRDREDAIESLRAALSQLPAEPISVKAFVEVCQ